MRAVTRVLASFLALACLVVTTARAQHPQTRQGFWIGFGFGYGSLGLSCSGCSGGNREGGLSGYLKMGGTLGPHLLLGGESNGWSKKVSGTTVTSGNAALALYVYPQPKSGFFLKGGVGISTYKEEGSSGSTGFGLGAGLGYDVRVGTNVSLTPVANFNFGSVGDVESGGFLVPSVKQTVFQLALGVTFH